MTTPALSVGERWHIAVADQQATKPSVRDYQTRHPIDWCPGCGDFGVLSSLHQALAALQLPRHKVAIFGGIGCSGKTPYYVRAYSVTTLHGRVLPYATGAKLANPELTVVAVGGDGDGLGIGAGHFVNTGRRNIDLTYIFYENKVYGLTKGQAAPTLPMGLQTKSLPQPTIQNHINPLLLAMAAGFTWIGRAYAYDVRGQAELIKKAIQHPGLAFLDVLQPCPTYNDLHTRDWYGGTDLGQPRTYDLNKEGYDPVIPADADDAARMAKLAEFATRAIEWGERIPTGVFLENRAPASFEERIANRMQQYVATPPAQRQIADKDGRPLADLSGMFSALAV